MITISTTSVRCIVWYSLQTRASVTTVRVNTRHVTIVNVIKEEEKICFKE